MSASRKTQSTSIDLLGGVATALPDRFAVFLQATRSRRRRQGWSAGRAVDHRCPYVAELYTSPWCRGGRVRSATDSTPEGGPRRPPTLLQQWRAGLAAAAQCLIPHRLVEQAVSSSRELASQPADTVVVEALLGCARAPLTRHVVPANAVRE